MLNKSLLIYRVIHSLAHEEKSFPMNFGQNSLELGVKRFVVIVLRKFA